MPIVSCTTRIGGATKSRVLADTQPKIVMNALAKQPFADFTAEQKRLPYAEWPEEDRGLWDTAFKKGRGFSMIAAPAPIFRSARSSSCNTPMQNSCSSCRSGTPIGSAAIRLCASTPI